MNLQRCGGPATHERRVQGDVGVVDLLAREELRRGRTGEAMAATGASRGGTAFADPGELEAPEG